MHPALSHVADWPIAGATAPVVPPVPIPVVMLLTIIVILAASSLMLWVLIQRETSHRFLEAMREWARESGFRCHKTPPEKLPEPLNDIARNDPRAKHLLTSKKATFLQFSTEPPAVVLNAEPQAEEIGASSAEPSRQATPPPPGTGPLWNVLIRNVPTTWPTTGARPTHAASSVIDLFSLGSFPLLGNSERFVIYSADSAAARALAGSSARALLPPDVGLLLHGSHMVLDFSGRPFDAIEFTRMLVVADQLIAHLQTVS
jgi:hypothetical protein